MKPAALTLDAKPSVDVVVQQQDEENASTTKTPTNKFVKRALIGLATVAVVTGIVIGAVYFGYLLTKSIQEESLVEFRTSSGQQIFERILVTEREEIFETPTITAIYDFKTYIMVFKYASVPVCYVSHFSTDDVKLPGDLVSNMTASEMTVSLNDPVERLYQSTGVQVSRDQLSERGQDLCRTSKIFWVVEQTNIASTPTRERRATTSDGKFCICLCCNCCNKPVVASSNTTVSLT